MEKASKSPNTSPARDATPATEPMTLAVSPPMETSNLQPPLTENPDSQTLSEEMEKINSESSKSDAITETIQTPTIEPQTIIETPIAQESNIPEPSRPASPQVETVNLEQDVPRNIVICKGKVHTKGAAFGTEKAPSKRIPVTRVALRMSTREKKPVSAKTPTFLAETDSESDCDYTEEEGVMHEVSDEEDYDDAKEERGRKKKK